METKSQPNDLPPVLVSEDQTRHERIEKIDAALQHMHRVFFQCKARHSACDPPQECGWPTCGCDPYADKVIEALDTQQTDTIARLQGENARLTAINGGLVRDHNSLLVDGARWQTRAEAAEAALSALRSAVKQIEQEMRAALNPHWASAQDIDGGQVEKWADTLAVIADEV